MKNILILLLMTFAINLFSQELLNHALIIGNNNGNDAKNISDLFELLNYETELLTNIKFNKTSSVNNYIKKLPTESLFIFYYSGSIIDKDGTSYLVPDNWDSSNIDEIGLSVKELTKRVLRSKSNRVIIVLDQTDKDIENHKIDLQARSTPDKNIVFIHSVNSSTFTSSFIKNAKPYTDIFEIVKNIKNDLGYNNGKDNYKSFNEPLYISTVEENVTSDKYGTLYVKAFEACNISYDDSFIISMEIGDEISIPLIEGNYNLNISGINSSEVIKVAITQGATTEIVYMEPEAVIPDEVANLGGADKEEVIEEIVLETYNSEVANNFEDAPQEIVLEEESVIEEVKVDNEVTSTKTTFEDDQKKVVNDIESKKSISGNRIVGGAIMTAISAVSFVTPVFVDSSDIGGDITMWSTGGVFSILGIIEIIRGFRGE